MVIKRIITRYFWSLLAVAVAGVLVMTSSGCEPNPLLRRQGMDALEVGDIDWADNRFSVAVRQDPTDWKSQYYLGRVRLEQDRAAEAQIHLEQALTLREDHPETSDILDVLAEALFRQAANARLYQLLHDATQNYGTLKDYLRQADYLAKTGDIDGAKVAFRKAARFADKDDATPYVAMADFYESIGNTDNAISALRRAYAITPGSRRLANRLREYGIVPGPTAGLPADTSP